MNKIFYFSSTGNCLYVAKEIQKNLGDCELISISKAMQSKKFIYRGETIGIIFPLHCFGLPIVVKEFIEKLSVNKDAYIFVVEVTGGGQSNYPLIELKELLNGKGEIQNYTILKYISNYTRMGKNPTEKRANEAIYKNTANLNMFINSLKNHEKKSMPSGYNILHKSFYKLWSNSFKNKDKNFKVDDKCIGCSICSKICPVANIELINKRPTWKGKCVDCMACINACPTKAINLGKSTEKKNRYRNPFIKVDELF